MKKTATITFHASHNYGSMLQAYALQQTLCGLGVDNSIINLRTQIQKKCYPDPTDITVQSLKFKIWTIVREILYPGATKNLSEKYSLFESFLTEKLRLTPEFDEITPEVASSFDFDYFITGSDQCWNTRCRDFNWAYYLNFTDSPNKISYASSIGPISHSIDVDRVKTELSTFRAVSVREQGSANFIAQSGLTMPQILPDPTLLRSKQQWIDLCGKTPLIRHPYIFMYSPFENKDMNRIAIEVSKRSLMPVVVSNFTSAKTDFTMLRMKGAKFKLNVGPVEFVNLIANASTVISGSFHAVVFSIIMNVPFWAVNGDKDNRMKQMLEQYGFEDRAIHTDDVELKLSQSAPDFRHANSEIEKEQQKAINYLKTNLDING